MTYKSKWRWINLCAFAAMVLVNILANVIPIGGKTTNEISAMYPSPLTPAPFAFSIWAVIYIGLAAMIAVQLFRSQTDNSGDSLADRIGPWFLISSIANITWLMCWHLDLQSAAIVFMFVLLAALVFLNKAVTRETDTWQQRWLVRLPVRMYFAWITVAAISNVSVWLMSVGFTGFGIDSGIWQIAVLLIGGVILTLGINKNHSVGYGLTAMWGYAGILTHHMAPDMLASAYPWTIAAGFVCEAAFLIATLNAFRPNMPLLCVCKGRTDQHPSGNE